MEPSPKPKTTRRTPAKPRSEKLRPEITRLPALTPGRRLVRAGLTGLMRCVTWLIIRLEVRGLEHLPRSSAALIVSNHLGDADVPVGMAVTPRMAEVLAKAELYDFPVLGRLMDLFGVIWLHRGQPDRRAIRAALQALEQGRLVALAPEGRESVTGALEEGTQGAAFLALKARVPVVPVTLTGTENSRVLSHLKRLRRAPVTLTVGEPFFLEELPDRQAAYEQGTERIMLALAQQLPPEYQGIFRTRVGMTGEEKVDGRRKPESR